MQSTRSCSTRLWRISPSPDEFEDIEPLASTTPAVPLGAKMMDDMLQPTIVGIASRWRAVFPAHILTQPISTPIADVEWGVGKNEVSF